MKTTLAFKKILLTTLALMLSVTALGMQSATYTRFKPESSQAKKFASLQKLMQNKKADARKVIQALDKNKRLIKFATPQGTTLLMHAIKERRPLVAAHLLRIGEEEGIDFWTAVHYANDAGDTAMSLGIQTGNTAILALLGCKERPEPKPQQFLPILRPGASPRQVLGLPAIASKEDAKRAYRRLALIYHPDKFNENKALLAERGIYTAEQAQDAFTKISNAWDKLK